MSSGEGRRAAGRAAVIVAAALLDAAVGEPATPHHPVAWLGKLIAVLERRRPRGRPPCELVWGAVMVGATVGVAALTGRWLERVLTRLPGPLRLPAAALALQPAFALRGLIEAAESVRDCLGSSDIEAARERLRALVSRDRQLDEPHVVSAAVESLAENLTDSVTAPLLAYAAGGLPAAYAYRAVNTLDAMIGYRGEYEHVGKLAAHLDDAANFVPARITGALISLVGPRVSAGARRAAAVRRRDGSQGPAAARRADGGEGRAAPRSLEAGQGPAAAAARGDAEPASAAGTGPNKLHTIVPMAEVLGVQLEKPGVYRVGRPRRPLAPGVIADAVRVAWGVGAAAAGLSALAALLMGRGGRRRAG